MNERIVQTLQKVLALTTSPEEGEAQAAAFKLQELLLQYNLDIADLETRGKAKSMVNEAGHDLGKAAFTWKLNLAEGIAKHYYCHPLIDRKDKTVAFIGRPDNVDSLKILYQWLIDQIRRISSEERKVWIAETGDHVDPLRWQVNFGIGAADRLKDRLEEKARRNMEDARCMALVVHHDTEISDYLEKTRGYRTDGRMTEQQRKWQEDYEQRQRERQELKERDIEEYYRQNPWDRPLTEEELAEQKKKDAKSNKQWEKKWRARQNRESRRTYREPTTEEIVKKLQSQLAKDSGRKAGDRINLEPFVEYSGPKEEAIRIG